MSALRRRACQAFPLSNDKEFQNRGRAGIVTRAAGDDDGSIRRVIEEESMVELVARLMERIDAQLGVSRVLPIVLLVALSFSVYFVADVLLEIYRMRALIVFVAL
jgi:hypothetical protein